MGEQDNADPGPATERGHSTHRFNCHLPQRAKGSSARETWLGAREEGMPKGRVFNSPGHREVEFAFSRQEQLCFTGDKVVK